MYLSYSNGFFISESRENAIARFLSPVYIEENTERSLPNVKCEDGTSVFEDGVYRVRMNCKKERECLFKISLEWENLTEDTRKWQGAFSVAELFGAEKYLIPCVSMNGNEWGAGLEPKGLTRDGKPWIFGYDRTSIPSTCVVENGEFSLALFASGENEDSLISSVSVTRDESGFTETLWYPVRELPLTYSGRDKYSDGYESYRTVAPRESFTVTLYLTASKPRWKNFGIADTLDLALDLFPSDDPKAPDEEKLWKNSIAFTKTLMSDYKGKRGLLIGITYNKETGKFDKDDYCFELAWCGQNVLFSRMLIEDYIKTGNEENLKDALEILDTRAELCTAKSGLLAMDLRHFEDLDNSVADTCNMGYGAYEFLRVYERLLEIGIDKPLYYNAARGLADFFVGHFSDEWGFGKSWRLSGECVDTGGTIGAFVILPLAQMYKLTGDKKYLDAADRALRLYVSRDLDNFACTAGALDTCCVDKETSAPIIMAGMNLYELTGEPYYLECAEKAAYYFTSWMYHYQPIYSKDCDFSTYGVTAKGMTAVSAQHHHLDPYALIIVPYVRRLAKALGDPRWERRAELMWRGGTQCVSDENTVVHGFRRLPGSQNEAFFQNRWTFKKNSSDDPRGDMNDWFVAWPCAFRMSAMAGDWSAQPPKKLEKCK